MRTEEEIRRMLEEHKALFDAHRKHCSDSRKASISNRCYECWQMVAAIRTLTWILGGMSDLKKVERVLLLQL